MSVRLQRAPEVNNEVNLRTTINVRFMAAILRWALSLSIPATGKKKLDRTKDPRKAGNKDPELRGRPGRGPGPPSAKKWCVIESSLQDRGCAVVFVLDHPSSAESINSKTRWGRRGRGGAGTMLGC